MKLSMKRFGLLTFLSILVVLPCFASELSSALPTRTRASGAAVKALEKIRQDELNSILNPLPVPSSSSSSSQDDELTTPLFSKEQSPQDEDLSSQTSLQPKSSPSKSARKSPKSSKRKAQEQMDLKFSSYLQLEQEARRAFPELVDGLQTTQSFVRRLPPYWSKVGVTDAQRERVYAIEQVYFPELAQLEARIERLRAEREATMLNVLEPAQRIALEQIRKQAELERGKKQSFVIEFYDE